MIATSIKKKTKGRTLNSQLKKGSVKTPEADTIANFPNRPLSQYTIALADRIKTSEKVMKHSVLKSKKWTKSCYDVLSRTITDDLNQSMTSEQRLQMGTSLSSKTLQKIVKGTYKVMYPIDPRTINTLNKVALFLGHKHWDDFTNNVDQTLDKETEVSKDPEVEIKRLIEEAVRTEHSTYCHLPAVNEDYLSQNFIKNSPAYNLIMDVLVDKSEKGHIISNNYNPSSCEILDIDVIKKEDDYAQVYTREYWLLCWWDTSKKKYVKRYKDISDHYYIVNKVKDKWLVKTNASTSDPMEIK